MGQCDPNRYEIEMIDENIKELGRLIETYKSKQPTIKAEGRNIIALFCLNLVLSPGFYTSLTKFPPYSEIFSLIFNNMLKWRDKFPNMQQLVDTVLTACALVIENVGPSEALSKLYSVKLLLTLE
jgi:hypothetical protein